MEKDVPFILRTEGGTADQGLISIYDAASMIYGLARAANIVNHAFANDEEVRKRADRAHGSETYVEPPAKGCYEEQVVVRFHAGVVDKVGHSVLAPVYWDYLSMCWSAAIGTAYTPTTSQVKKMIAKNDFFLLDIADSLEEPLRKIQRPIAENGAVKMFLNRPRVGDVITLDQESLAFVTVREESQNIEIIQGNVTRYNVLSDFGRLYSDEEGRVISFTLKNTSDKVAKTMFIDSMQALVGGEGGKLLLKVTKVVSASGVVKRYIVHSVKVA